MANSNPDHELIENYKTQCLPLSAKLTEMLNEHYTHQTERRGCGYTQATRVIAEYVNTPRDLQGFDDFKLFEQYDCKSLKLLVLQAKSAELELHTWRNLDQNIYVQQYLEQCKNNTFKDLLINEIETQKKLRLIKEQCKLEESKLICDFIEDIILPKDHAHTGLTELKHLTEKPKVGSCPMAEKFFLKVAHHQLLRQGVINIFVDQAGEAVMMEKLNMGDDHSCISLKPLIMNGVRLPAGSLFATDYNLDLLDKTPNKKYKGHIVNIDQVPFWFLRITTLAIQPKHRARAFTTHFKQQIQNGLLNPEITELHQIYDVALQQL